MIDTTTQKPVQVKPRSRPLIMLPYAQLPELENVLKNYQIEYEVSEETISLDGEPEVIFVRLRRGTDPNLVQQMLDRIP